MHWSLPDPSTTEGTDRATYSEFRRVAAELDTRIQFLLPTLTDNAEE
jgi:hypothetical protein